MYLALIGDTDLERSESQAKDHLFHVLYEVFLSLITDQNLQAYAENNKGSK